MRLKLELDTEELNEAVDFFSRLFDQSPESRTAASAEFSIPGPELNLILSQDEPAPNPVPERCC